MVIEDIAVAHCSLQIPVPKNLLNRSRVHAGHPQVAGTGVAEVVNCAGLDSGFPAAPVKDFPPARRLVERMIVTPVENISQPGKGFKVGNNFPVEWHSAESFSLRFLDGQDPAVKVNIRPFQVDGFG